MRPEEIETRSFEIIDQEAGTHPFTSLEWSIVRRIVHTTADFEYIQTVRFHPKAIDAGVAAIQTGCHIITDTHMARAGIRKSAVENFCGSVHCFINDPSVVKASDRTGSTRARAAVDAAEELMEEGVYAVGNAPTALLRIIELVEEKRVKPALVIGFPVGFVNAEESKAALAATDIPYITNVGRKGGSNVAAAVVNALIKLAVKK